MIGGSSVVRGSCAGRVPSTDLHRGTVLQPVVARPLASAVAVGLAVLFLLAAAAVRSPAAASGPSSVGGSDRSGATAQLDAPATAASSRATAHRADLSGGAYQPAVGVFLTLAAAAVGTFGVWLTSSDRVRVHRGTGPRRTTDPRGPPATAFV